MYIYIYIHIRIPYNLYIFHECSKLFSCDRFKRGYESNKTVFQIKLILNTSENK